ncbi:hypothetical protein POTOM_037001 [Populus tomentosa]|uniref:Uncharacterized protein n=1 Tax=Populus tomentosa TaxID=118781 RepID=A0A8X7YVS8_POPTO|nr:hypothetical protein POTOM_037001 [Populus tomentosa]
MARVLSHPRGRGKTETVLETINAAVHLLRSGLSVRTKRTLDRHEGFADGVSAVLGEPCCLQIPCFVLSNPPWYVCVCVCVCVCTCAIAGVQDGKAKLAAILAELLYNPTE